MIKSITFIMNQTNRLVFKWNTLTGVYYCSHGHVHSKINPSAKRGILLSRMVSPARDKSKNWHMNIGNPAPKSKSIFEKIHRPTRRQIVLSSLFIKNITDVLSTGDVAPELMGYGVEITNVKISPCYKILNVFWQIPPGSFGLSNNITEVLKSKAFEIRAELINRNVLGKIPHICFVRDVTNARVAAFEEALKQADMGPESSVIPDDEFLKDVLAFKESKSERSTHLVPETEPQVEKIDSLLPPPRPDNMRSDIFGLKRDVLIEKVMAGKKVAKDQESSSVQPLEDSDVFSRISGEMFNTSNEIDREKILKKFQIERKKLMKSKKNKLEEDFQELSFDPYTDETEEKFVEDYYTEDVHEKQ